VADATQNDYTCGSQPNNQRCDSSMAIGEDVIGAVIVIAVLISVWMWWRRRRTARSWSGASVMHGFDVVAVRIEHERAVVPV
jgi:hypothetical protein